MDFCVEIEVSVCKLQKTRERVNGNENYSEISYTRVSEWLYVQLIQCKLVTIYIRFILKQVYTIAIIKDISIFIVSYL